jgi:hypothetical protein
MATEDIFFEGIKKIAAIAIIARPPPIIICFLCFSKKLGSTRDGKEEGIFTTG